MLLLLTIREQEAVKALRQYGNCTRLVPFPLQPLSPSFSAQCRNHWPRENWLLLLWLPRSSRHQSSWEECNITIDHTRYQGFTLDQAQEVTSKTKEPTLMIPFKPCQSTPEQELFRSELRICHKVHMLETYHSIDSCSTQRANSIIVYYRGKMSKLRNWKLK
mgnify:CR=1 FL=1